MVLFGWRRILEMLAMTRRRVGASAGSERQFGRRIRPVFVFAGAFLGLEFFQRGLGLVGEVAVQEQSTAHSPRSMDGG